jgi:hypothetical protein
MKLPQPHGHLVAPPPADGRQWAREHPIGLPGVRLSDLRDAEGWGGVFGRALWTIRLGCGRQGTNGPAASNRE